MVNELLKHPLVKSVGTILNLSCVMFTIDMSVFLFCLWIRFFVIYQGGLCVNVKPISFFPRYWTCEAFIPRVEEALRAAEKRAGDCK